MKKLFFLLLFLSFPAHADKNEDILILAKEAYDLFPNKTAPFSIPEIEFVSVESLYRKVCGDRCSPGFLIKGIYSNGKISLRDDLDLQDVMDTSFIIHELMHYYQEKTGIINNNSKISCEENIKIEMQAYMLQNQWLMKRGTSLPFRAMQQLSYISSGACANE